jgi:hypothetical protein
MTVDELAEQAETALRMLATSPDPAALEHLLRLSQVTGVCIGDSARTLAEHGSWAEVGSIAGTTRQAAWARWHQT